MRTISYPSPAFERLARSSSETPAAIRRAVARILDQVRRRGDAALVTLSRRFDGVTMRPSELRVPNAALRRARVPRKLEEAAISTFREVNAFARNSLPRDWVRHNGHGAVVGEKFDPLKRVGIYVPGGSAPLVSTIFMTVVFARMAGVKEIVVCTPPPVAEPILWALNFCGVKEVYRIGGAQAIAAMAYGTKTIRPVDKVFGPGNAYVTEAKRQLFGMVGVDLLAGPSELMVLADRTAVAEWAAADLLAQAEHGSGRERVFCVSDSAGVLQKIGQALRRQAQGHGKNAGLNRVLRESTWFIRVRSRRQLAEVANRLAPEHLQIMTRKPHELAVWVTTAGGIFLGNYTPTVLGDFAAGPSHTLPTSGAGRSFSGLRTIDFMRRTSLVEYPSKAVANAQVAVAAFATAEELPLHGQSLARRIQSPRSR
jgi:histidinol dehydrogenase